MKAKKLTSMALIALIATLVNACSPDTPDDKVATVSDENCKPENIAKIKGNSKREEFQNMCFRRGQFKPSPKKEW